MAQGHRFAELLSQVTREITLRQAADVCCGDLTLEQFQTLRAVSASEQASIGSLSSSLRVDLSTMSRNVTVIVHVAITGKGRRALETLRCEERDVLQDVYERLPTGERPRVLKALEALRTCLDESTSTGAACCPPSSVRKGAT